MIDKKRFEKLVESAGIALSANQYQQFIGYDALLDEWNQKINLTAITKPEEVEQKHFIDSLLLAVQPEIQGKLVDVGSGAGFPGLVAAIYNPTLTVTLMEPTGKRATFLAEAAKALALKNVSVVKERAEEAARKQWRQQYSVATARAVASMQALAEYCLPLVKTGGWFIAMKGPDAEQETEQARHAIEKLGGAVPQFRRQALPNGDIRCLVLVKKENETPKTYPRNGGTIAKRPL